MRQLLALLHFLFRQDDGVLNNRCLLVLQRIARVRSCGILDPLKTITKYDDGLSNKFSR